jgi:hypothetical protein
MPTTDRAALDAKIARVETQIAQLQRERKSLISQRSSHTKAGAKHPGNTPKKGGSASRIEAHLRRVKWATSVLVNSLPATAAVSVEDRMDAECAGVAENRDRLVQICRAFRPYCTHSFEFVRDDVLGCGGCPNCATEVCIWCHVADPTCHNIWPKHTECDACRELCQSLTHSWA